MNRNRMTAEQIEAELKNNEARFIQRPVIIAIGRVVVSVTALFANDETIDNLCEWFAKRSNYLKVGRIKYGWRDFEEVRKIHLMQLEGTDGK